MTTNTASSNTQSTPGWALWLVGIAALILLFWLWNTANTAKSTAQANAELLATAELELSYVLGGPSRFSEQFDEAAEELEIEDFEAGEMMWSTALITNTGLEEAEDVMLSAEFRPELEPTVLATLPSYGSGVVDVTSENNALSIDLRDIGDDERAFVFFGFDPESLPDDIAQTWPSNFDAVLGSLSLEGDELTETVYGRWL